MMTASVLGAVWRSVAQASSIAVSAILDSAPRTDVVVIIPRDRG